MFLCIQDTLQSQYSLTERLTFWRHLNDARATIPAPGNSLFVHHPAANHPVVKKEEVIIAERSRLDYKY